MKNTIYLFVIASFVTLFVACENKEDRSIKDAAVSLVSNQDDIVNYGFIDVKKLVEKGELEKVDVIGQVVMNNLNEIKSAIRIEDKLFYALAGPYDRNGMPSKVIGMAKVVSKDSVLAFFAEMGFMFEEEKGKSVYHDMSTAIGVDEQFVVFVTADFDGDPKLALLDAFKYMNKKEHDDKVAQVLNEETELLLATNLKNLYATSNTSLGQLPEVQQKEIEEMVEDSHVSMKLDFNPGNIAMHVNTSRVSESMKNAFFFKENGAEKAAAAIGPGQPIFGMAAALDIAKMEQFINQFSPGAAKEMYRSLGIGGFFIQAMGSKGIASLVNGDLGVNLTGIDPEEMMYGGVPAFNAYVGLGSNGQNIKDLIHTYAEEGTIEDLEDGYYRMNSAILLAKEDAFVLHSNDSTRENFSEQPIERRSGMDNFGNKPLFIFADFKQVNEMGLPVPREVQMFVELTDYGTIEGDHEGVTLKLIMKNSADNALKQVVQKAVDGFAKQISNISI